MDNWFGQMSGEMRKTRLKTQDSKQFGEEGMWKGPPGVAPRIWRYLCYIWMQILRSIWILTEWKKTLNNLFDKMLFFVNVSHLHSLVCIGLIDHVTMEGVIEAMQILNMNFLSPVLTWLLALMNAKLTN